MRAQLMFSVTERRENVNAPGGMKMGGLKLGPVYPKEGHPLYDEMKKFYSYTPGGQIDFSTVNEAVLDAFPPGTICAITIQPFGEGEVPGTEEQVLHLHDIYKALGVEWGADIFGVITHLQGISAVDAKIGNEVQWASRGFVFRGTVTDVRDGYAFVAVPGYPNTLSVHIR